MIEQTERIKPGYKLVLAAPDVALSDQEPLDKCKRPFRAEHKFQQAMLREYLAIYNIVRSVVTSKNLVVIKGLNNAYLRSHMHIGPIPEAVRISFLDDYFQYWPRDALTIIGEEALPRRGAWQRDSGWWLGEGGAVLSRNRTLLVAEGLFHECGSEIGSLLEEYRGVQVAKLPHVRSFKGTDYYKHHIDGHSSLIEGRNHDLMLLLARSYFLQNRGQDKRQIEIVTKSLGIGLEVIDDKDFPPLAFNLIQLADGAVVMTSGADELELTVKQVVGEKKVFTTDRPVELLPIYSGGGIRCMTNIFPQYLIN